MKIGYFLSSEEWGPRELVSLAAKAEAAGFEDLWISDHYHPWNRDDQRVRQAGFDELYISQIGPEQDAFFEAYRDRVLPRVR